VNHFDDAVVGSMAREESTESFSRWGLGFLRPGFGNLGESLDRDGRMGAESWTAESFFQINDSVIQ
jgi:hypothetical protein